MVNGNSTVPVLRPNTLESSLLPFFLLCLNLVPTGSTSNSGYPESSHQVLCWMLVQATTISCCVNATVPLHLPASSNTGKTQWPNTVWWLLFRSLLTQLQTSGFLPRRSTCQTILPQGLYTSVPSTWNSLPHVFLPIAFLGLCSYFNLFGRLRPLGNTLYKTSLFIFPWHSHPWDTHRFLTFSVTYLFIVFLSPLPFLEH